MEKHFLPALLALCLVSGIEAFQFHNAYIQNVKSSRCVTIEKDELLNPLIASKCICGAYQFWKMDDEEHIINELAKNSYIDEFYGKPANGETVGIYALTGSAWQKWRVHEGAVGIYSFVNQYTSKCLRQGQAGKIEQWDCDDTDQSQQWKIIENPCEKQSKVPNTEPIEFNNAYIINAKSDRCVTVNNDANLDPLALVKCTCGSYQLWRRENGDHIINELALHGYMDEFYGKPGNGETVGIYDFTGSAWQKWRMYEENNGNYAFVNRQTGKCLHQGSAGKVDQWDCDDSDDSQQWKVIENPCGKLSKLPSGRFQLQNIETGKCASILDNSNAGWAKVVSHTCSCDNTYHYWTLKKMTLVSEGVTKQCLANWEKQGHPGVTQCGCVFDAIHNWRFSPLEDGTFNLVTQIDGRCVYVADESENTQLQFQQCNRDDPEQKWRFYDSCHPEPPPTPQPTSPPPPPPPTNVIPSDIIFFFESGSMNWLTPTRYSLLIGGRWDSTTSTWITADGRQIKPGTAEWTMYFGDAKPSFLNVLFPAGKTWNEVFGWMSIEFFQKWTSWQVVKPTQPPQPKLPSYLITYFNNGQMNWLTPTRYQLLVGGRWDATTSTWLTAGGQQIKPGSTTWTLYFGDATPSLLNTIFENGDTWNDRFGWMTSSFFQRWTNWKVEEPYKIRIVLPADLPQSTKFLFASGRMNSLTPDRIKLLAGGQWTGSEYLTKNGVQVKPGTMEWTIYFGSTEPADVNTLFGGGAGTWDTKASWLTEAVKDVPAGQSTGSSGSFAWDSVFKPLVG